MKNNEFVAKVNDKEVRIKVIKVTKEIALKSNSFYSQAFEKALQDGLLLRKQVENLLKERGIYDSTVDEKEYSELSKKLKDLEITLRKGVHGNRRMSKQEGRAIAIEMRKLRRKINLIGQDTNSYFSNTVESVAENERIQYLIFACTVLADSGETYWKSYENFKDSPESENDLIASAMKCFIANESGVSLDRNDWYENTWLKRMNFMDSENRLLDENGKFISEDGRWIDKDGRFINEDGKFVDEYGNLVDENGRLIETDTWAESPQVSTS